MAFRFRDLTVREFVRLLGPFIGLLVTGLLGRWLYPHEWPLATLADAFFEAAAIAGLLAIGIELFSAKRLIEHVSRDLAGRLVGRHLPRQLQQAVSDLVVKTDLVMHDYLKVYRLLDTRSDGYLDVEMTISYDVINYSEQAVNYAPLLADEAMYEPRFMCLEYSGGGKSYALDQQALNTLVEIAHDSRVKTVKGPKTVSIRPCNENPEAPDRCKVLWRHIARMPYDYSDVTSFARPAVGISLRVDAKPEDLDFFAGGADLQRAPAGTLWESSGSFITGQHVRAWWFKRQPPSS